MSSSSKETTTSISNNNVQSDGDTSFDYDLVVIGGGSGGVRASRISSGYGAKVALIEPQLLHGAPNYSAIGGTCVNVGCVPKKLMVFAARFPALMKEAVGFGWKDATLQKQGEGDEDTASHEPVFDWKAFMAAKDAEITRLNNVYNNFVLSKAGVEVIEGFGVLDGPNAVQVKITNSGEIKTLTTKNILIAVGGWPFKPSHVPGIEHAITSNEIFYLKEQPKRMVIVGGGFIALEFATIMDGLGTDVTLMYRGELFLRGFDYDMRVHLKEEMERNTNIRLQFQTDPTEIIQNEDDSFTVVTNKDGASVDCDVVMYATGRKGRIEQLQLDKAGVESKGSFIPVDNYSRTNVPSVYAVGDVTDRIALTPVALMEGHRLADTLFGGKDRPVDHNYVASTVFTNPEIGTVGYTEEEAVEKFRDITVYKNRFRAMRHSFPKSETYSLFKIIVETATQKVVGVHIASDDAGEILQGIAVAMKMGATKDDLDATIGIHPTSAEELVTMRDPSYFYKDGIKVSKL
jgi:glutathione reductase (NADPH)